MCCERRLGAAGATLLLAGPRTGASGGPVPWCPAIVTDMSPHPAPAPAPTVDPGPAQNVISNTDTAARYLAPAPPRTTDNRQLILYIFQIYYLRKQHLAGDRDVFTLVIENIDDPMTGLTSGGAVSSGL